MGTTDPIHAVSSIHAYARLAEIERLREHHDDLFRERGRVTAEQLRHVRRHAENLLQDLDRLIADIEDVPAEDVRLRHDSEAIAAMVAVVLRRHGEATARMAVAALQDRPAASVDGEAATRRETRPAEPATASPADGVPAANVPTAVTPPAVVQEPPAVPVQAADPSSASTPTAADPTDDVPDVGVSPVHPSTAAREAALAEMDAVRPTDIPSFVDRPPTRRTTDLTSDEEIRCAAPQPHPMCRPGARPRPASAPDVDDELFGVEPTAPSAAAPLVRSLRSGILFHGTMATTIIEMPGPMVDAIHHAASMCGLDHNGWATKIWQAWADGGSADMPPTIVAYPDGLHRIAFEYPKLLAQAMDALARRTPWSRKSIQRALMLHNLPVFTALAYRKTTTCRRLPR